MTELLICTLGIVLALLKISMKEGLISVIKGWSCGLPRRATARKRSHSHD